MGEAKNSAFRMNFNRSIRVEDRDERLSGDAGALLLRETMQLLGLDSFFEERLDDPRSQKMVIHPMPELVRTSLFLLAQGYENHNDSDRLRDDPTFRLAVSDRTGVGPIEPAGDRQVPEGLGSQPTLSRLCRHLAPQLDVLREALIQSAGQRIRLENNGHRLRYATVDIDSFPVEVFGQQEGATYNGYYGVTCFHPLVASLGETGDLLAVRLREGNAHTAAGSLEFILPLLDRMESEICQVASVRMDAGFPSAELLQGLDDRRVGLVARLRSNQRLEQMASAILDGKEPEEDITFHELSYQADTWGESRRVVLVVKPPPEGELFSEHFFLLTNWSAEQKSPEDLLEIYRQRGTAEGHFGDFKNALGPALSSTQRRKSHYRGRAPEKRTASVDPFAINETRLLLNALAFQLMHTLRSLLARETKQGRRLVTVRDQLLKAPARVIKHARQLTVVLSKSAAGLWRILRRGLERMRRRKERLAWT